MRWSDVTAVFGGSFDPPHLGHQEAAQGLLQHPGVRQVLILPTGQSPEKTAAWSAERRLEMCQTTFSSSSPQVQVSNFEVEKSRNRPGVPLFTFDTVLELSREWGELAFVLGTDQLRNLPRWSRFPALLQACHWIVLARRPEGPLAVQEALRPLESSSLLVRRSERLWSVPGPALGPGGPRFLTWVETPARALSSSQIRESIVRTGSPPSHSLHPTVEAELKRRPF